MRVIVGEGFSLTEEVRARCECCGSLVPVWVREDEDLGRLYYSAVLCEGCFQTGSGARGGVLA